MTSNSKKPPKPDDFPVDVEGQKIMKQDGTPTSQMRRVPPSLSKSRSA